MSKKLIVKDHNEIRSKPSNDLYRENWEKIFGKKDNEKDKPKS